MEGSGDHDETVEKPTSLEEQEIVETGEDLKAVKARDLWDEIGFHRPLAGFWYKLIFEIFILIVPALLAPILLVLLYPYPTSIGYTTTFTGIFVLVFQAFDLGTANTINRFVADSAVKDPGKMVKYVQYFIWYQMTTGLVQISGISFYVLAFVPNSNMAYGIWIMLLVCTKQYPGFPGVFKGTLESLQQYNKKAVIDFIQGEGIQRLTEIVFVLLGRWYGMINPAVGELMGIAIGAVLGLYLDDVIAAFIAGWYLSRTLKPQGITFGRLFKIEFDWALVKECTIFGLKTGLPGIIFATTSLIELTLSLMYIPQYTTYVVLKGLAIQLMAITQRLTDQNFTALFTEAYQTGKKKLCQYYNVHAIRFFTLNSGFAIAIILTVISIFEELFIGFGLDMYILTMPFLLPALLYRATRGYVNYPDNLLIAAHRPNAVFAFKMLEEAGKIACWFITIPLLQVYQFGIVGVVYTLTLGDYPAILGKAILDYIYVHKTVFKLNISPWQTFVAPIMSTLILFGIFFSLRLTVIEFLFNQGTVGFALAIGISIPTIFVLVLFFYFPLTVFLGGWDMNSVRDFRKVEKMAGPSKILVKPMAKVIFWAVRMSRKFNGLHDRFRYDETEALAEMQELFEIRKKSREKEFGKDAPLSG